MPGLVPGFHVFVVPGRAKRAPGISRFRVTITERRCKCVTGRDFDVKMRFTP
jgi:hypothetical protein